METFTTQRERKEPEIESRLPATEIGNTAQAAKMYGVSKSWLYKNWKDNPAALRAGRALRWDLKKLREWMRQQAQNP